MYCADASGKTCHGVIAADRTPCGPKKVGSDRRAVRGLFSSQHLTPISIDVSINASLNM